jgi:hypothetical protein
VLAPRLLAPKLIAHNFLTRRQTTREPSAAHIDAPDEPASSPFTHSAPAAIQQMLRRQWLPIAGFSASALVVVAGGRIGQPPGTTAPSRWLGLLSNHKANPHHLWPGLLLGIGVVAVICLWLVVLRGVRDRRYSPRRLWTFAGCWSAPLLFGPPLLSNDVYSYVAQGLLVERGQDPYTSAPSALGLGVPLSAVDPIWRNQPSPYGPLASTLEHFSVVAGGSPVGAILVLRVFAALSVVAIGLLAVALAPVEKREFALALTVLNPLVLLHVIAAVHFEGVMCALLLGAILAANRGQTYLALVLGCAAGAVKAPALFVVAAIVFTIWQASRRQAISILLTRCAAVVVTCWLVFTLLIPHGWGWLRSLGTPALGSTPAAPTTLLAAILKPIVPAASGPDLNYATRVAGLAASLVIAGYLLVTAHHRSLARTTGLGLLAVSLLGPVFYPWYALWGLLCLAPTARGRQREFLIGLSAIAAVVNLPGMRTGLALGFDLAVALALFAPLLPRRRRVPAARREVPATRALTLQEEPTLREVAGVRDEEPPSIDAEPTDPEPAGRPDRAIVSTLG